MTSFIIKSLIVTTLMQIIGLGYFWIDITTKSHLIAVSLVPASIAFSITLDLILRIDQIFVKYRRYEISLYCQALTILCMFLSIYSNYITSSLPWTIIPIIYSFTSQLISITVLLPYY